MKIKRTVLYVIDTLATGGAEKSLLEISAGLREFIPVVCILRKKQNDLSESFAAQGIQVINLDINNKMWWAEGAGKLKKVIESVQPAVVHATLFKAELITRLALRNKSIVQVGSFVNDSYSPHRYRDLSFVRKLKLNIVRMVDRFTARRVTHFMSISKAIAESNAAALDIDTEKISIIYRGRNVDRYRVSHPDINNPPFVFLTVARLLKRKGYIELLSAIPYINSNGRPFVLRVAGEGNDFGVFRDLVIKLGIEGKVEFLMNRTDVPLLLEAAHCFVFPSHYEGQGGALVEAMLAGKPIVVSDIPVFREQITDNVTGKFFTLFDERDLARKLEWMMSNYEIAIRMGDQARSIAVERFNISGVARKHDELYEALLKKTSQTGA